MSRLQTATIGRNHMNDDDQSSEAQEPTDEDMAEILGEEPSRDPLPQGRYIGPTSQQPPQERARHLDIAANEQGSGEQEGLVSGDTIDPLTGANACTPDDEASLEASIKRLPNHWMRVYVAELYRSGDPSAARKVVCAKVGTLRQHTLERMQREYPEFGALVSEHAKIQHEAVDAAVYRGATEGDDVPLVSQGAIVGSYKKRCVKSGELWMKRHGLMAADQVNVTHTGRVEIADESQMADMLRDVALLLHGQPKLIEGKVVSESDKKDG